MAEFNIDEWMSIAEKYGAIFKNITFVKEDKNDFVRAVAKNPLEDFYIEVGFPILLHREDILISDEIHKVDENKVVYKDLRKMLNEYLNFIFSEKRVEQLRNLINEFNKLPENLKIKLQNTGLLFNIVGNKSKKELKEMLLGARTINFKGKPTFMPFIDFINHNFEEGIPYGTTEKSIYVKGSPLKTGEIFAVYNTTDDFNFLNIYFFSPQNPFAYSIGMRLELDDGKTLIIRRQIARGKVIKGGLRIPEYKISSNIIELSHLWIGSVYTPRRPFWSFRLFWENQLGRKDTIKVFSLIKSFNLRFLVNLLQEIEELWNSLAKNLLKRATLNQIRCISHSFEEP